MKYLCFICDKKISVNLGTIFALELTGPVWSSKAKQVRTGSYGGHLSVAKQGLTEKNLNIKEKEAPRSNRHDSIGRGLGAK